MIRKVVAKMYSVYKHTTPNGKVYIGITGKEPEKRWMKGRGYQNNPHFSHAIKFYGWENIEHEILRTGLTRKEAEQLEVQLIAQYDSTNQDKGYNCTNGGETIGKHTLATRRLLSEIKTRQYATGEVIHPMLGTHFSEESRAKMSKSHSGKTLSVEHKKKIGQSCKGLLCGNKNPMAKRVICVDTGVIFETVTEAAKSVGLTRQAIYRQIKGFSQTAGGYRWQYAT